MKFNWCRAFDNLATHTNNFRVVPRITLLWYLHNCWHCLSWYETLQNPTVTQTSFVSLVTALLVPIMKFYMDGSSPITPTAPKEEEDVKVPAKEA